MEKSANSKLSDAVCDYITMLAHSNMSDSMFDSHRCILRYFVCFVRTYGLKWENIFTDKAMESFIEFCMIPRARTVIKGISRFLYYEGRIIKPVGWYQPVLPDIFQKHLEYITSLQTTVSHEQKVLTDFAKYLEKHNKTLKSLTIEDVDYFLANQYRHLKSRTQNVYKSGLRKFLKYLYEEGVIQKNYAPMLKDRRVFAMAKPPKFIRPAKIKKLFSSLQFETVRDYRTNAMLYLAFSLGLRPNEIQKIKYDDISFADHTLTIHDRKNCEPVILPLPEDTVKVIAAYVIGARPECEERTLFLSLRPEYKAITSNHVTKEITAYLRKAGLKASSYWLRHTYAQTLLEKEVSIFEIKEMMGHKNIQTTKRYIQIDIKMMRKVLFNETI